MSKEDSLLLSLSCCEGSSLLSGLSCYEQQFEHFFLFGFEFMKLVLQRVIQTIPEMSYHVEEGSKKWSGNNERAALDGPTPLVAKDIASQFEGTAVLHYAISLAHLLYSLFPSFKSLNYFLSSTLLLSY